MSDMNSNLPIRFIHIRGAAPADADMTFRVTGAHPDSDNLDPANIWALDVNTFLHGWDNANSNWDRVTVTGGALDINLASQDNPINVDVDGVYSGGNTNPDNMGIIAHVRNAAPGDTQQTFRSTGIQGTADNTVWALDVAMHDENGDAYTLSNPLPIIEVGSTGTPVNSFGTNAIAALATATQDYTVTALKTLHLEQIEASGSGKIKIEVQVETGVATGVFTSYFVQFNSTANPNCTIHLDDPILVAAGVRVRIIKSNLDHQPFDVYATICGFEV